jgi:hypothetical protein
MADLASLGFELERRLILFKPTTTLPDNSLLGYDGDPNGAVSGTTAGQTLIYACPTGTHYQQSTGELWFKRTAPNEWIALDAAPVVPPDTARTVSFVDTALVEIDQVDEVCNVEVWLEGVTAGAINFNVSRFNTSLFNQANKYTLRRTNDYDIEIVPSDALMTITLPEAKTGLIRIQ